MDTNRRAPRNICIDCKVDTTVIGEFYMVADELWETAVSGKRQRKSIMLCIGCLEERLGRQLQATDFKDVPVNRFYRKSARFSSRLN